MLFKRFDVDVNWVQIDDDVIPRPAYICVGDWLWFWDSVKEGGYNEGFADGYKEAKGRDDDE